MTKILIQPISLEHIKRLVNKKIDGYIIGLEKYSIFQNLKLSIEEIKKLDFENKEIFISINKPIHNEELDELKENLKELSKLNIKGILYEDVSVVNINKHLNLNLNLIWASMHLPTNSKTCNYWNKKGVKGALLSTELMVSDFVNIKKNTNMIIMVNLYGHIPILESARTLLSNYFLHINKNKENDLYLMYEKERDKYFNIYEENENTFITGDVLNGINIVEEIVENDIDYVILNSLLIDEKEFNNVIDDFVNAKEGKKIAKKDVYTGFLFKESIFKVKE